MKYKFFIIHLCVCKRFPMVNSLVSSKTREVRDVSFLLKRKQLDFVLKKKRTTALIRMLKDLNSTHKQRGKMLTYVSHLMHAKWMSIIDYRYLYNRFHNRSHINSKIKYKYDTTCGNKIVTRNIKYIYIYDHVEIVTHEWPSSNHVNGLNHTLIWEAGTSSSSWNIWAQALKRLHKQ